MLSLARLRNLNGPVIVSPESLNVAPTLIGAPLASPARRVLAITLDGIVIGLLSSINGLWPIAGAAMVIWRLRNRDAQLTTRNHKQLWLAFCILVLIAVAQLSDPATKEQVVKSDGIEFTIGDSDSNAPKDTNGIAQRIKKELDVEQQLAKRIDELDHELKLARQSKARTWIEEIKAMARSNGLDFGCAIAYFTLLPFWWKGQTVGKRVFRLRIVELTGRPLTLMHAFSRYGGYAAGMATGGFGFLQVLWDHNRQAIQDKIAHTVVVDSRLHLHHASGEQSEPIEGNAGPNHSETQKT